MKRPSTPAIPYVVRQNAISSCDTSFKKKEKVTTPSMHRERLVDALISDMQSLLDERGAKMAHVQR